MASMATRVSPAATGSPAATATFTTVPGSGATRAPAASCAPGQGEAVYLGEGRGAVGAVDEHGGVAALATS